MMSYNILGKISGGIDHTVLHLLELFVGLHFADLPNQKLILDQKAIYRIAPGTSST